MAEALRSPSGAPLGEAFAFLSALYFRGKLAYARRFAPVPEAVQVIVPGAGLLAADTRITAADLRRFAGVDVGRGDMSRGGLLLRSARAGTELDYAAVLGATRTGKRPPKLPPR
jgi:hypothetical protein